MLLGSLFFLLLVLAGLTTAIALLEPLVLWLVERSGHSRVGAAVWSCLIVWVLGLLSILSFSYWSFSFEFAGINRENGLFDILVILSSDLLLPLLGLSLAMFVGWGMGPAVLIEELDRQAGFSYRLWFLLIRYVVPVMIVLIFFQAIGVV